jgi:hypothetical protein
MKRGSIISALALAVSIAAMAIAPGGAGAFNCHSWGCVNRALNKMQKQVNIDTRVLGTEVTCFGEAPLDQFGDPSGSSGYSFNTGTSQIYTTALDVVPTGGTVGAWVMTDTCNRSKANIRHARLSRGSLASAVRPIPWAPTLK